MNFHKQVALLGFDNTYMFELTASFKSPLSAQPLRCQAVSQLFFYLPGSTAQFRDRQASFPWLRSGNSSFHPDILEKPSAEKQQSQCLRSLTHLTDHLPGLFGAKFPRDNKGIFGGDGGTREPLMWPSSSMNEDGFLALTQQEYYRKGP